MADRQFLRVGKLPGREKPCLYVEDGAVVRVLAHFKTRGAMEEFLSFEPLFVTKPTEEAFACLDGEGGVCGECESCSPAPSEERDG